MAILPHAQFSLFAGASGAGKTTLLLQAWKEHELHPGSFPISFDQSIDSAGLIIADRTASEAQVRADYLGIKNLEIYGIVDDHSLSLEVIKRPDLLRKEVLRKFKTPHHLYFIDPIGLFMEGSLIDYKSVAASFVDLNRLASKMDATFLGVHHTTKARSDFKFKRPQDRVSGSGAFAGYSSTQIMLIEGAENDEEADSLIIVPHLTPKEEFKLIRREDGYFVTLEQHSKNIMLSIIDSLKNKFMKVSEFKSDAARTGLTDAQIKEWLDSGQGLRLEGGYVLKA